MAVLEATLKEFKKSVEKRFEQTDKRFERVDKRFEQVDKRMASKITFIKILVGIFTAMTIATIGFAIWDRWAL
jgi:ferritin-like metal-binding protein YciE